MRNTYWNRNGKYQEVVNRLEKMIDWLKSDLGLPVSEYRANEYDRAANVYKRYYNDGDIPRGFGFKSTAEIETYLESRVNTQVEKMAKALGWKLN